MKEFIMDFDDGHTVRFTPVGTGYRTGKPVIIWEVRYKETGTLFKKFWCWADASREDIYDKMNRTALERVAVSYLDDEGSRIINEFAVFVPNGRIKTENDQDWGGLGCYDPEDAPEHDLPAGVSLYDYMKKVYSNVGDLNGLLRFRIENVEIEDITFESLDYITKKPENW